VNASPRGRELPCTLVPLPAPAHLAIVYVLIDIAWSPCRSIFSNITTGSEVEQMTLPIFSGCILLVTTIHVIPAQATPSAEGVTPIRIYKTQSSQSSRQGAAIQGSQRVRPSPQELAAISEVLETRPRPKALTDADVKYLKELLGKPAWYGFEQRIVHEIWTEVNGKEWRNTEGAEAPRSKTSP